MQVEDMEVLIQFTFIFYMWGMEWCHARAGVDGHSWLFYDLLWFYKVTKWTDSISQSL